MTGAELPVLALVGPTAAGKSDLGVQVALALTAKGWPAEVVNGDSMLVYKGMDIGTAKPSLAQRAGVPHHLIDILEVTQTASVAQFQVWARDAIADCRARSVLPVLVGGSALYVHAVLDDMAFPPTDAAVRARWQAELDRLGPQALHDQLAARAPDVATDILPGNGRRIVRALEAIELTGTFVAKLPPPHYALAGVQQIGLTIGKEALAQRIRQRVDQMWAAGLVDEVRELAGRGLRDGLTASRALGYRQVLAFLDHQLDEDQAKAETIAATWRFARKQATWFKRDQRIDWLPYDAPSLGQRIVARLQGGPCHPAAPARMVP